MGWPANLFRTAWGLILWNLRNSLSCARRGQGRCPCQNPSDSRLAAQTGCEAVLPMLQPLPLDVSYALLDRFRRPVVPAPKP